MSKWMVVNKKGDFEGIAKRNNISPMLARIFVNKGISEDEEIRDFLDCDLSKLKDPHLMKDMDKARDILSKHIDDKKNILIIGDYDIDGVCSSYILKRGLFRLGNHALVRLPHRIADGYGMNMKMVDEAYDKGVDIILTCDNGIAAYDEIEYANSKGIKVIVTDHHEVPFSLTDTGEKLYRLPNALAVVDPKQEDCPYPFDGICGGVVAFKLIQCLYEKYGIDREELYDLLPYAAFATVGDIMELKDENRVIVSRGLDRMRSCRDFGLNALIDACRVDRKKLSPYHLGYVLGPCINATGRLDSPDRALELLLSKDHKEATLIASELRTFNDDRKSMQALFTEKAIRLIDEDESYSKDTVLVLYLPDCHESLAGLIAGKLREKYSKPSFVLTDGESCVKGSGRSIEAYDMFSEMNKCKELFLKFGGHKMAAGLSLEKENVSKFREKINAFSSLKEEDLVNVYNADMQLHFKGANLAFAKELERLEPYGNGNSKPLFCEKGIRVVDTRILGNNNNTLKLTLVPEEGINDPSLRREAMIFGEADRLEAELKDREDIKILFELSINSYMGKESPQLTIKDYKLF
ncbi:MAG: single-stranded-DNA-specific exonuclease RecJ [Lachnospiraceae bacterium]|nr:single-stranded-DNA-specific exonuclease RecJ [Lachnospiraceae bacterium]